jgi:hypothetical protein
LGEENFLGIYVFDILNTTEGLTTLETPYSLGMTVHSGTEPLASGASVAEKPIFPENGKPSPIPGSKKEAKRARERGKSRL